MEATHRVTDSKNGTIGFIVDDVFFTDYYVKENIKYIENLSLSGDGIIQAKQELPGITYRNAVIGPEYEKLARENPFKREIQGTLDKWKEGGAGQILQVEGARQIGKTTELKKFAYKNYEYVIYANMADDIYDFIGCVNNGANIVEFEKYCRRAGLPHFVNSRETVLIIDEIQESTSVFNALRRVQENIVCDIIITGSYLGKYMGFMSRDANEKAFFSAGNIEPIEMFSLSFKEFCAVFGQDDILGNISLYGESEEGLYKGLYELYTLYCSIGGYPGVVKRYVKTHNIEECYEEISKLLNVFRDESAKYFSKPKQAEIFSKVYTQSVNEMLSEKRGNGKNMVEDITGFVKESAKDFVSRDEVSESIVWLKKCNIISTCALIEKNDFAHKQYNRRMYLLDCGITSYIMNDIIAKESSKKGLLAETFVFSELNRLYHVNYSDRKVKEELCFSVSGLNGKKYELDFMLAGKGGNIENVVFGIEVKANRGRHESLNVYLDNKFVDKGILAGKTAGGRSEKFDTIPIYTVGCRFPYF